MLESAVSLLSLWASMNSWLTPAVLFLLLNLMIGTIAVTSAFSSPKPHHHQQQQQPPQIQTHLTRPPSVLQHLKSLNFYAYIHSPPQPPPLSSAADSIPEAQTPVSTASTSAYPVPETETQHSPTAEQEPEVVEENDEGPTLDEVYSLIVKKGNTAHYSRQKSDTDPSGGEIPVPLSMKIKKSATDKSAFAHFDATENAAVDPPPEVRENATVTLAAAVRGGGGGDVGVDAKADDFINNFRKQLLLQRLESLCGSKK